MRGDDTRAWGPPFLAGESAYYLSINRNKESVARRFQDGRTAGALLDALDREGRRARRELPARHARRARARLRGSSSARHPRLIYVSISGFGQNGPRRDEAGYDAVAQAEGGLMSITGTPEGPPVRLGVAIADIVAGHVRVSGTAAGAASRAGARGAASSSTSACSTPSRRCSPTRPAGTSRTGEVPARTGNRHMTIAPYDTFDAADGVLVLAVGNDTQWQRLCDALGLEVARSRRRASRRTPAASRTTTSCGRRSPRCSRARTLGPLVDRCARAGVPCGAVRSVAEALADPQIAARAMVETVEHPTIGPLSRARHADEALGHARRGPHAAAACSASTPPRSFARIWAWTSPPNRDARRRTDRAASE